MQLIYRGAPLGAIEEAAFLAAYPDGRVIARRYHRSDDNRLGCELARETDSAPGIGPRRSKASRLHPGAVGKLVSAAPHPDGGYAVLVVLQIASAEGGPDLHLGSAAGPAIELEALPYPFPSQ